jgi:hypothetical protein
MSNFFLLFAWGPSAYASGSILLMAYCTIRVLDFPTFSTSFALPRPQAEKAGVVTL